MILHTVKLHNDFFFFFLQFYSLISTVVPALFIYINNDRFIRRVKCSKAKCVCVFG